MNGGGPAMLTGSSSATTSTATAPLLRRPAAAAAPAAAASQHQQHRRRPTPARSTQPGLQQAASGTSASASGSGLILPPSYQREQQRLAGAGAAAGAAGTIITPAAASASTSADGAKPPLRFSWAGGGIYFWWQLGAVQWLSKHYDLTKADHGGASAGALLAALARCGVDPDRIVDSAYRLSVDHKIWERPLGLVGVWGSIIEAWLHELLPADAAERCGGGGLGVVVARLPALEQVWHEEFESKSDLVDCVMASAHVPWLLDLKLSRRCRGAACVDGSLPDFFSGVNADRWGGQAVLFDYFDDPAIARTGRFDMLKLKEYAEIKKLALLGARFAQRRADEGAYDGYDAAHLLRTGGSGSDGSGSGSGSESDGGSGGGVVLL